MNPLRSLVFHRYFSSVKFIRGLYLVHFDETLEKFDLSSIFPKSGIFQRYRLNSNLIKLLRWSDLHRCILNVDFSRGSHLVYFNETFEKFRRSSIVSKCGFFRNPHSVHSRWNPWKVWFYIDILWVWNFSKVHPYYISDGTLRSLVFHRYFRSVEFFRGPHLVHLRWNSWEVGTFIDIF